MIDWAGCTTVMIGWPSPKTRRPFRLSLTYVSAPVEEWAAGERSGWFKGTCTQSRGTLGQMQAQSSDLGASNRATLAG